MWRRDRDPLGRSLVAECEAFLAGRYAEHLTHLGRRIPVWAWTNLIAHGNEQDLRHALRPRRSVCNSRRRSASRSSPTDITRTDDALHCVIAYRNRHGLESVC